MNEFFKKLFSKITALWAGWTLQQRIISIVVIVVLLVGIIALFRVSASPVMVSIIDYPISDENDLYRIVTRLNAENVRVNVTANGLIQVENEAVARRMRTILISEGLLPTGVDPWQVFDRERWTLTDFERNVNFQRAQQRMIIEHIRAVDGVDDASINIVWPTRELFRSDQNPVSASVLLIPTPGSDIADNRMKVEGIQRLLQLSIEGLLPENIVITDHRGIQLNDFEGMAAFDRLSLIERENRFIRTMESHYRSTILTSLQAIFTRERVRDLNIKIDMDLSKMSVDTYEILPTVIRPRTPGLPYDDSEIVETIIEGQSISSITWRGTGFNPEGPAGVEGQVPPAFRDMSNLYGEMTSETETTNYQFGNRSIQEERSPQIERVTVSVNIDGRWKWVYDDKGNPVILSDNTIEREYIPVSMDDLRYAGSLIRDAVGFNSARGDSVTVTNIPVDRTEEFRAEDAAYFRRRQIQTTIIIFFSGLVLLLFGFVVFRMISREMERRRRIAEEERARREQMLRESAMAEAEEDGTVVSISLEERARMELMENAINMAKEHPEDAAQLIRTWILEE